MNLIPISITELHRFALGFIEESNFSLLLQDLYTASSPCCLFFLFDISFASYYYEIFAFIKWLHGPMVPVVCCTLLRIDEISIL